MTAEATSVRAETTGWTRPGVRLGPVGIVMRRRTVVASVAVLGLTAAVLAVSVFTGTLPITADRVWATLAGGGSQIEQLVVLDRRLARAAAAALVGFALGCAGALTQSITRNPIATPDILGVTAGASVVAVFIVTRPDSSSLTDTGGAAVLLAPAAFAGGLLTTGIILALAWRNGFSGLRLILVGLGVNSLALAAVSWLLTRASLDEAAVAARWLTGSMAGARLSDLGILLPSAFIGLSAVMLLARGLAAVKLGRDVASTLGTSPGRTEGLGLLVAVVLVSVATAVAGPISFVAFVAPQAAMRLFGTAGPPPLAGAACGALLVAAADLVAQRLPVELPVGILTAAIGAPYLLYLLTRHVRRSSV